MVFKGRVKSDSTILEGRWSVITGGPAVYADHGLHGYIGNITESRGSDGNIGHDANPSTLVEHGFSLVTISGVQGSGSSALLSNAEVPW